MNNKQLFILSLIIVGTISAVLLIIFLGAAIDKSEISEGNAQLLSGIIIALIAVVSFLIGKKLDKDEDTLNK